MPSRTGIASPTASDIAMRIELKWRWVVESSVTCFTQTTAFEVVKQVLTFWGITEKTMLMVVPLTTCPLGNSTVK